MKRILGPAACLLLVFLVAAAHAQQFPSKPVTLIVPWPAGGSTDIYFRKLGEITQKHLGQNLVIENRPGGSGNNGPTTMAKTAQPDGYTISQLTISAFRAPHMQKVDWNPVTDFTYIIGLAGYTFGVVVKADSPFKTFNDLIAYARANPGKLSYATPGTGTSLHLAMEEVAAKAGVQLLHVPFKGYADGAIALMGGHVMVQVDSTGWAKQVDAGAQRLLATLDQPAWYMSSEDYARWAVDMLKAERATIERVGLLLK